jgi:hypothetical protein
VNIPWVNLGVIVDVGQLLRVAATALGAGVGVSVLFSVTVLAFSQIGERDDHLSPGSLAFGAAALAGLLGCAAVVVYGVVLLSQK